MKAVEPKNVKGTYEDMVEQAIASIRANGDPHQLAAISVCDETLATLRTMESNLLDGVKSGLIEICEQIAAEQTQPATPERIVLELVAKATNRLVLALSKVFEDHRDFVEIQRDRFVLGKIKPEAR